LGRGTSLESEVMNVYVRYEVGYLR